MLSMDDLKHRHFASISYNGNSYNGWQIQANAPSVQQVVEEKFSTIFNQQVKVTGAGRTDTGVHAKNYVFHFEIRYEITDYNKLVYKLNSFLPKDIVLHRIWNVDEKAHARFDALSRTYEYHLHFENDPFLDGKSYYLHYVPNLELMNEAANILFDYKDFTSFCKLHSDNVNNLCNIKLAKWEKKEHSYIFTISADRFLRNMVRAITGTMIEIGRQKISLNDFRDIIEIKDRNAAGPSVPPDGLFFTQVSYPESIGHFN